MKMFRGDLEPDLVVELFDGTTPLSLATATAVRFVGYHGATRAVTIDRALAARPTDGVLTIPWISGETDTAGSLVVEIVVTWPGTRQQTFRADTLVTIAADLA